MAHRFWSKVEDIGSTAEAWEFFIHLFILFLGGKGRTAWRIVRLGKIPRKRILKKESWSLSTEIRYSRSSCFTNLNDNSFAVQKYDILVNKPLQAAGMSDAKVCGWDIAVRTSVTHSAAPRVPLFCSYHILTSSVIYYWTDARKLGIYLLNNARSLRHRYERAQFTIHFIKEIKKTCFSSIVELYKHLGTFKNTREVREALASRFLFAIQPSAEKGAR